MMRSNMNPATSDLAEGDVRLEISQWLKQFQLPTGQLTVRNDYTVPFNEGRADIYCPGYRLVIETKKPGLGKDPHKPQSREKPETPFEQLTRYITAFRSDELKISDGKPESDPRDWLGIVTDGTHWHGWSWRHHNDAQPEEIKGISGTHAPQKLLADMLSQGGLKRPPVPQNLADHLTDFPKTLDKIHAEIRKMPKDRKLYKHTENKFSLWLDMLKGSGMAPEDETGQTRLFVSHTFLVALARCVTAALTYPDSQPDYKTNLQREGFIGWVEEAPEGSSWLQELYSFVTCHDWRTRRLDVLRTVYHRFVEASDRKVFGEYYTPDWLAELVVETVLDDEWVKEAVTKVLSEEPEAIRGCGVLDPTCGSGTFLYYAARRLLRAEPLANPAFDKIRASGMVALLVNGIDIHPVATELAKATLLRALPAVPLGGVDTINVFQGDALMLDSDTQGKSLFSTNYTESGKLELVIVDTPEGSLAFPKKFITGPNFPKHLTDLVRAALDPKVDFPSWLLAPFDKDGQNCLYEVYDQLKTLIRDRGDSVWAWYILNRTAPLRLAERKIDRVVANPPWVRMNDIQVKERKDALETRAREINLWGGKRVATSFDIASLFPHQISDVYAVGNDRYKGGWVIPSAFNSGGQWEKFRSWHKNKFEDKRQMADIYDLQPFGSGVASKCCILFENTTYPGHNDYKIYFKRTGQAYPSSRYRLAHVKKMFKVELGEQEIPQKTSSYVTPDNKVVFRQGATIVPAVLSIIKNKEVVPNGLKVKTIKSSRSTWAKISRQQGIVPKHWVRPLIRSDDMLPFLTKSSADVIVPTTTARGKLLRPGRGKINKTGEGFWEQLESHYKNHRTIGKHSAKNLLDRLNYAHNLEVQINAGKPDGRRLVYAAAGDIMRASRITDKKRIQIINHMLYWWDAESIEEACFLVAILNAPCLEDAFAKSRVSAWHFDQHPWRKVPIPQFIENNSLHLRLVEQTLIAEKEVKKTVRKLDPTIPPSNRSHSKIIRNHLAKKGIFKGIDDIVSELMPNQARSGRYIENPEC